MLVFVIICISKTRVLWLLQYTLCRCFESVVQNALDARGEGDQNRVNCRCRDYEGDWKYFICLSVNGMQSTYAYKIRERDHVDKFINNRSFKSLNEFPDRIYQVVKIKIFFFLSSCTPKLQCCNLNTNSSPLSATQTDMS